MPPKQIKRKRQLMEEARKGREARKTLRLLSKQDSARRTSQQGATRSSSSSSAVEYPSMSALMGHMDQGIAQSSSTSSIFPPPPAINTNPSGTTRSSSTSSNTGSKKTEEIMKTFAEQWKATLDQEDLKSLAVFLCHVFTSELDLSHSKAAEHTAKIIGKTERTIRQWRTDLITHGEIKESKKGKYERPKVLWANKELNDKARTFVQANTAFMVQGKQSTMKVKDFCQWVNETLLPNQAVASLYSFVPGYGYAPAPTTPTRSPLPQKISMETARKWLRELGF